MSVLSGRVWRGRHSGQVAARGIWTLVSAGAVGWRPAPACLACLRADARRGTMASFPYRPVAPATGLSDAFTERAAEPATAHSHRSTGPKERPRTGPCSSERTPTDPICTVTDRRQVDPDDAPNGGSLRGRAKTQVTLRDGLPSQPTSSSGRAHSCQPTTWAWPRSRAPYLWRSTLSAGQKSALGQGHERSRRIP